jgi:hypothetical protein
MADYLSHSLTSQTEVRIDEREGMPSVSVMAKWLDDPERPGEWTMRFTSKGVGVSLLFQISDPHVAFEFKVLFG